MLLAVFLPFFACFYGAHSLVSRAQERSRRQLHLSPDQTVELNFSVPFIFSARLYPYGADKGDAQLPADQPAFPFTLRHPLTFFGEKHDILYILRDGAVAFSPTVEDDRSGFPAGPKLIAPFWAPTSLGKHGRVFFRETSDENTISLAASEVEIQYRYSTTFTPTSVIIATWENVAPAGENPDLPVKDRNLYQLVLIQSDNGTFAHIVYSKLKWHSNAQAGLNEGNGYGYLNLPGSGTPGAIKLANLSDIGIPGEWIFKIDDTQMYLCGPGFKGNECIDKCEPGEWYYDCSRGCHCGDRQPCNIVNGHCNGGRCADGWGNSPTCDIDKDECAENRCDGNTPDCINTPGAFICTCLRGYDNSTRTCRGADVGQRIEVVPQAPNVLFVGDGPPNSQGVVVVPGAGRIAVPTRASPISSENSLTTRRRPIASSQWSPIFPTGVPHPSFAGPVELLPAGVVDHSQAAPSFPILPTQHGPFPSPTPPHLQTTSRFQQPSLTCGRQCPENAECILAGGLETCSCKQGYSGDGNFCADINECFLTNSCDSNAKCENTLGSYKCVCEEGSQRAEDGRSCVDIDECAAGLADCPGGNTSQCVNTNGGFECRCKTGYNGNPSSILGCIDINECLIPEFYCGPNANCRNTEGGYVCTCLEGFEQDLTSSVCIDVDECAQRPCDKAAQCINTAGSFICRCLEGFSGDGFTCTETILYPFSREEQRLPVRRDAFLEITLDRPVTLLGQQFRRMFISSHGIISFDAPLTTYADRPIRQIPLMGLAPLYEPVDLTEGGGIFVKQTTDVNTLTRSELTIRDSFNEPDFEAEHVVVITFDDVKRISAPSNERNRYQVVISSGQQGSYATYIYDQLHSNNAKIGLVATDSRFSVTLPGSGDGSRAMAHESNIQRPGKWTFRIDLPQVITCPAGFTGPPYCLQACQEGLWGTNCSLPCRCANDAACQPINGSCPNGACLEGYMGHNCYIDIDECALELARCHPNANCLNYAGSYGCECKAGFLGDGVECSPDNACQRSGLQCSLDAICIVGQLNDPICQCREGFEGNGVQCNLIPTSAAIFPTSTFRPTPNEPFSRTTSSFHRPASLRLTPGRGFPGNNVVHTLSPHGAGSGHEPTGQGEPGPPATTSVLSPPSDPSGENDINSVLDQRGRTQHRADSREPPVHHTNKTSSSSLLVIVIPAVLCGIWLILIIVLLIVCLRKRKQRQKEKYGLGYFSQTGSVKGSTNGAYYGSSQWSMPPRVPYDYYPQGYAADPYAPYKY